MSNNLRELNRKQRASAEYERMIRRYPRECGKVKTYTLTQEELARLRDEKKPLPAKAEREDAA